MDSAEQQALDQSQEPEDEYAATGKVFNVRCVEGAVRCWTDECDNDSAVRITDPYSDMPDDVPLCTKHAFLRFAEFMDDVG